MPAAGRYMLSITRSPVAVVMIGKGLRRQALSQIRDLVGIGNRIQTNQKGSSGTSEVVVTVGKPQADQTKITNGIRSVSTGYGRDW
jgi:hypothetical protein